MSTRFADHASWCRIHTTREPSTCDCGESTPVAFPAPGRVVKDYTSTLLRMAGNIAAGLAGHSHYALDATGYYEPGNHKKIAHDAVSIAEHILARVTGHPAPTEPPV